MLGRKNETKLEVVEYTGENSRTQTDDVSGATWAKVLELFKLSELTVAPR